MIAGVVTDAAGAPFPNARLMMDEGPEARSGADGRLIIRSIPAGTRQVEVLFVGMAPVVTTLRLAVLDGFDDNRRPRDDVRRIFGGFMSAQVVADRSGRIRALMVGVPACQATLWIDGARQVDYTMLTDVYPDELAAVEVYPRSAGLPAELSTTRSSCGAVAVWTKRGVK